MSLILDENGKLDVNAAFALAMALIEDWEAIKQKERTERVDAFSSYREASDRHYRLLFYPLDTDVAPTVPDVAPPVPGAEIYESRIFPDGWAVVWAFPKKAE